MKRYGTLLMIMIMSLFLMLVAGCGNPKFEGKWISEKQHIIKGTPQIIVTEIEKKGDEYLGIQKVYEYKEEGDLITRIGKSKEPQKVLYKDFMGDYEEKVYPYVVHNIKSVKCIEEKYPFLKPLYLKDKKLVTLDGEGFYLENDMLIDIKGKNKRERFTEEKFNTLLAKMQKEYVERTGVGKARKTSNQSLDHYYIIDQAVNFTNVNGKTVEYKPQQVDNIPTFAFPRLIDKARSFSNFINYKKKFSGEPKKMRITEKYSQDTYNWLACIETFNVYYDENTGDTTNIIIRSTKPLDIQHLDWLLPQNSVFLKSDKMLKSAVESNDDRIYQIEVAMYGNEDLKKCIYYDETTIKKMRNVWKENTPEIVVTQAHRKNRGFSNRYYNDIYVTTISYTKYTVVFGTELYKFAKKSKYKHLIASDPFKEYHVQEY